MRALVTTSQSGDEAEAAELAGRFGLEAQPRAERALPELLAASGGAPVLVLGRQRAELYLASPAGREAAPLPSGPRPPLAFRASLGMAVLRLQRARHGEIDPLVAAARLGPGDRVIDATLGLGGDALIAAYATGAPVLGLEASGVLAAFAQASLRRPGGKGGLGQAAREAGVRVEVRLADHLSVLRALPSRSAEVVLFDPMFRAPLASAPLFALVRACADPTPLSPEALNQARRVASRGVLVKDAPPGFELLRLGLRPLPARRLPRILFGWADALG